MYIYIYIYKQLLGNLHDKSIIIIIKIITIIIIIITTIGRFLINVRM